MRLATTHRTWWLARLLAVVALATPATAAAGPPYDTDDPEPVELHYQLTL